MVIGWPVVGSMHIGVAGAVAVADGVQAVDHAVVVADDHDQFVGITSAATGVAVGSPGEVRTLILATAGEEKTGAEGPLSGEPGVSKRQTTPPVKPSTQ